ncbi:hypothetical protein SK128_001531 [Halocaridina rubra]|uniref:Uncharacterized protein n=1 Tax=Halocaridina rubra TaxID=373956 RepID=A0AAN8X6R6_HALRR
MTDVGDTSWEYQPVPKSELEGLEKEKEILSTVYRHVEHQQALEQVAEVVGVKCVHAAPSPLPSSPLSYLDFPLPLYKAPQKLKETINSEQKTSVPSYLYRCIPDPDDPTCGPIKARPPSGVIIDSERQQPRI